MNMITRTHLDIIRLTQQTGSLSKAATELHLSQSALSQHLARLREAGMVATRRESQTIHYSIADPRLHDMIDALYRIYCETDGDALG